MSFSASVEQLVEESEAGLLGKADWWKRVPLSDVVHVLNGFPFPSDRFNEREGHPLLRIRDVSAGDTDTYFKGAAEDDYWVEQGDVIVGMDGDFNLRVWMGKRALLNQRVCKLTPDEKFYNRQLLAHVLPGYLQLINYKTHSITVKHLSSRTVQQIPLPLPPVVEQQRIVTKIDSLFARSRRAKDELGHIPNLIERYRQAVLEAAFRGDLTADWRERHPNIEPAAILADRLSKSLQMGRRAVSEIHQHPEFEKFYIPKSWEWVELGDVFSLQRGRFSVRPRNDPTCFGGEHPFVQIGDLPSEGGEFFAYKQTLNDKGLSVSKKFRKGTPLIAIVGATIANTGVLGFDACCPDSLIALVCPIGSVNRYVESYLQHIKFYIRYLSYASGGQPNINIGTLQKLPVPLPPEGELPEILKAIASSQAVLDSVMDRLSFSERLIDRLDQAILDKAFAGKLVPQDPNDEPASELLERIQAARTAAPKAKRGRRAKA